MTERILLLIVSTLISPIVANASFVSDFSAHTD